MIYMLLTDLGVDCILANRTETLYQPYVFLKVSFMAGCALIMEWKRWNMEIKICKFSVSLKKTGAFLHVHFTYCSFSKQKHIQTKMHVRKKIFLFLFPIDKSTTYPTVIERR